jgi:hypothetical protein
MPNSPEHPAATLRLVLSSAALIASAGGAVILALLELPQLLTLALALIAALALIDLAGTITTQQADDRSTARPTRT